MSDRWPDAPELDDPPSEEDEAPEAEVAGPADEMPEELEVEAGHVVAQEHAEGEFGVPDGYGVLEGRPQGGRRAVGVNPVTGHEGPSCVRQPCAGLFIIQQPRKRLAHTKANFRSPADYERHKTIVFGLGPHVSFVSGVPDERIVELYSEAELAIVPSLYEGFSLPAIEAMCSGTPLVATDGGALPEVTGTAYLTGFSQFLFDPADPLRDGFLLDA